MIAAADVHRPSGFFAQEGGFEYPAVLGLASAALALTGPGRYSVDAVVKHPLSREGAGIAALVASAAGAAGVLTRRKKALALKVG